MNAKPPARAVVLLSGGLDSATALALARSQGFETYALSLDYGQRHRIELDSAAATAKSLGVVRHVVVKIDLRAIGGSALTDAIDVPKDRDPAAMGEGIPVTYVPARNTILLSLALGFAETVGAFDLFIGANILDYSGYPDCRPEFLAAFEKLSNLATKAAIEGSGQFRVHSPLVQMTKAEIIRLGMTLGVDYSLTLSCYDPDSRGRACGRCDSCQLRRKGFAQAEVQDPTAYQTQRATDETQRGTAATEGKNDDCSPEWIDGSQPRSNPKEQP
jgi:7-cyano-7-deazaguanine synthase